MKLVWLRAGWTRWLLFIAGWTLLALLFVPETYFFFMYRQEPIPWSRTIVLTLANAAVALAFVPPIVWLTRRYPIDNRSWRKALLIHLPACLLFSLSHTWIYAGFCFASPVLFHMLFLRFHPNLLSYWAIVGFTQAMEYFDRFKERERQLAQAELHLLKAQLQPHFLFNTLHTISAMMHEDVSGADRMVNRLSQLLRRTLENIGKHEVPLRDEIEFLQSYLEIERVRFGERLRFVLDVTDEARDALVPSMLLQPLAENSMRHAWGSQERGTVTVRANRNQEILSLKFVDDGRGFSDLNSRGTGLNNIRSRLQQLCPERYRFAAENMAGGGAVVILEIPFRTVPSEDSAALVEPDTYEDARTDRGRRTVGAEADCYAPKI
jgi:two-component sensor histidine kinase